MLRRIWLCAALLLSVSVAHAELQIEINQGVENPTPIAVVPFAWQGVGAPLRMPHKSWIQIWRAVASFPLSAAGIC